MSCDKCCSDCDVCYCYVRDLEKQILQVEERLNILLGQTTVLANQVLRLTVIVDKMT